MRKKALICIVALALCFTLAGCKSKEAKATEKLIDAIGTVTLDSGEAISIAEQSYAALSPDDKSAVSDAKQRLDGYRAEYNLLLAMDEIDDNLKDLSEDLEIKDIVVEFDSETRQLTIPCILAVDDEQLDYLELYKMATECADTATGFAEEIEKILEAHQVKDVQVAVQLLQDDESTIFTEVVDGKVTKNIVQDYTDSKPSTRDNADFELACWGDDKETVLTYIKEPVWELDDESLNLFDQTFAKKTVDVEYDFNSAGQLYETWCLFNQANNPAAADYVSDYNAIKKAVSDVYGDPKVDETVTLSRLAGYTDSLTALKLGYIGYRTTWETDKTEIGLVMRTDSSYDISTALFFTSKDIPED